MNSFRFGGVLSQTFSLIGRSFASVGMLILATQVIMAAVQFGVIAPAIA